MEKFTELPEGARRLALARFSILRPHLEDGRPLSALAAAAGVPYRTAHRWLAQYKALGLVALSRRARADRGARRTVSVHVKKVIEGLALQKPPLPVAALYRQVRRLAHDLGDPAPTYSVVYDVVRQLPRDLVVLAHQGTKAYSEAFELVHRREAAGPNAIWQADHTLLDVLLVRPEGEAAKPWLTVVIDDHSRAVAGYFLSFDAPCTLHTTLALRQAIWRKDDPRWIVCGIPDVLYTDHGSDFTSQHLEQVSADIRMRLVFSLPARPRGRGRIERFFSTVNEMLLCELDGYAPPGGGVRRKPVLALAEFDTAFRAFLDAYHRREHSETKMAPVSRWEAGGFLPRMPESLDQLDLLLVHVAKTRQVHVDGIHFQGLRYTSPTLAAFVGATVTLRFDPRDMAEVRVFHDGRFICRAICAELAGASVPLREILTARNRRRRELRGVLRDRQATIESLLRVKHGISGEKGDAPQVRRGDTPTRPQSSGPKRYRNE
jgi:putative transposase